MNPCEWYIGFFRMTEVHTIGKRFGKCSTHYHFFFAEGLATFPWYCGLCTSHFTVKKSTGNASIASYQSILANTNRRSCLSQRYNSEMSRANVLKPLLLLSAMFFSMLSFFDEKIEFPTRIRVISLKIESESFSKSRNSAEDWERYTSLGLELRPTEMFEYRFGCFQFSQHSTVEWQWTHV